MTQEIVELARRVGDRERLLQAELLHVRTQLELADRPAAEAAMATAERLADGLRSPQYAGLGALFEAAWAYLEGRFDDIDRVLDSGVFSGPFQDAFTAPLAALYEIAVRRQQGRLDELGARLDVVASYPNYPAVRHSVPALYLEAGRADDARRALAASTVDRNVPAWALAMRAEACATLGDTDHAVVLYGLLRRHQGHMAVFSNALLCLDPVDRSLGLLAGMLHRAGDGIRHLEDAVGLCERFDAPALLARSRADLGRALVTRGRPEDLARGGHLLDLAWREATRLGMAAVADRPEPERQRTSGTPAGVPSAVAPLPAALTPREMEVLRLVAQGFANKQIARELQVSEKTAKTHVSNILAKLGVSDRTQAAMCAVRAGLVPAD